MSFSSLTKVSPFTSLSLRIVYYLVVLYCSVVIDLAPSTHSISFDFMLNLSYWAKTRRTACMPTFHHAWSHKALKPLGCYLSMVYCLSLLLVKRFGGIIYRINSTFHFISSLYCILSLKNIFTLLFSSTFSVHSLLPSQGRSKFQ